MHHLGKEVFPDRDPWGREFGKSYFPERAKFANKKIVDPQGMQWRGILEGIQSDQDYLRVMFDLQVGPNRQRMCHYCDCIGWVSNKAPIGPNNNPESLYTVYGPREGDAPHPGSKLTIGTYKNYKNYM